MAKNQATRQTTIHPIAKRFPLRVLYMTAENLQNQTLELLKKQKGFGFSSINRKLAFNTIILQCSMRPVIFFASTNFRQSITDEIQAQQFTFDFKIDLPRSGNKDKAKMNVNRGCNCKIAHAVICRQMNSIAGWVSKIDQDTLLWCILKNSIYPSGKTYQYHAEFSTYLLFFSQGNAMSLNQMKEQLKCPPQPSDQVLPDHIGYLKNLKSQLVLSYVWR